MVPICSVLPPPLRLVQPGPIPSHGQHHCIKLCRWLSQNWGSALGVVEGRESGLPLGEGLQGAAWVPKQPPAHHLCLHALLVVPGSAPQYRAWCYVGN